MKNSKPCCIYEVYIVLSMNISIWSILSKYSIKIVAYKSWNGFYNFHGKVGKV